MKLAISIVLLALSPVTTLHSQKADKPLAQRIVGEWEGPRHIHAFYTDGAFTIADAYRNETSPCKKAQNLGGVASVPVY
jgi:hypothetical protein